MPNKYRQKGISLFVVIVIVLISTLFTLWASRSSLFNELVISNDSDYQRAFEAAQALIQDAELDIIGRKPNGEPCATVVNTEYCRPTASGIWFPVETQDLGEFVLSVSSTTGCRKGICIKRVNPQNFWEQEDRLTEMIADGVGARYGQFTGAQKGSSGTAASSSILSDTSAGKGGWYWVEVLPYDPAEATSLLSTSANQQILRLNLVPQVAYRITAIARGLKPNTQVVLQSTFVRQKLQE